VRTAFRLRSLALRPFHGASLNFANCRESCEHSN
jgi:hypothetical protein